MQTQQLVTLVPWTLIAQLLNLFLQVYLIKRFLFKPINNILQKRKEMADAEIKDAEQAKTEALAMKESYEKDMAEAKEKAGEILTTAEKTAGARSEEIIREASRQAAAIKEKAEKDIEAEKKKAARELKDDIGGMAVDLAGKVIERELNEQDHEKLIDDFIRNVGEAS